jgi:hypothetical protein
MTKRQIKTGYKVCLKYLQGKMPLPSRANSEQPEVQQTTAAA